MAQLRLLTTFCSTPDYAVGSNHTFKFFLSIFSHLGLIAYQPPPQDNFIFVPFPTNVLTVYRYYIYDFGLYGALAVMAVIGSLQTLVYRKARSGSKLAIYFFAITLFETLMLIFSDEYASFGAYIDSLPFAVIYIVLRSLPIRLLPLDSPRGMASVARAILRCSQRVGADQ